jgi:4-hydroxy-3-polyprenylbenzoate decarboxylase
MKEKFVIGVTGGSGSFLAITLLRNLENYETHVVVSGGAKKVFMKEIVSTRDELLQLATCTFDDKEISAGLSSCEPGLHYKAEEL